MPSWREHFQRFARYNVWATERLLGQHIEPLDDDEYRRDAGLYFKSVHGTLNHLLLAEYELWFVRFAQGVSPKRALNEEVESDRARLAQRLREASQRWAPLIASWDEARFDGTFDYVTTKGVAQSLPFAAALAHVFNHGTHHRGQISAAITAMGRPCPELDMVWMLQAESRAT
jgi:uncharacterized damage-inducible protein DinB